MLFGVLQDPILHKDMMMMSFIKTCPFTENSQLRIWVFYSKELKNSNECIIVYIDDHSRFYRIDL